MIITTCGYGNSGSSAVMDYLKGYEFLHVVEDVEFQLLHMPDGLLDLRKALTNPGGRLSSDVAIQRFIRICNGNFGKRIERKGCNIKEITETFIQELNPVEWNGFSVFEPSDITGFSFAGPGAFFRKIILHYSRMLNLNKHPFFSKKYFSIMDTSSFDAIAREYINNITKSFSTNEHLVLDMLLPTMDPERGRELLPVGQLKTIVVRRDPRDIYLYSKGHSYVSGFLPYDSIDEFIRYYKMMMDYERISPNTLYINFEDLIYKYNDTTEVIRTYLDLKERPKNEFMFFNPDISVKNTFPYIENSRKNDVKKIEIELEQYLYEFPQYVSPITQ